MQENAERLHKYIAKCGITSRRKAEELITQGRITVNGEIVTTLGTKVTEADEVTYDGRVLSSPKLHYVLMNKPKGVVTTMDDPQGRKTVANLLPDLGAPIKPVGRLDKDTDGLLIFTNDGEFAMRLSHPRYSVEKEYRAIVEGVPTDEAIETLCKGVYIEGGRTRAARAERLASPKGLPTTALKIVLHEGRKRQVRLMCEAIGHPVIALTRVRYGPIVLRDLRPGQCRLLSVVEVRQLKALVNLEVATAPDPKGRAARAKRSPR